MEIHQLNSPEHLAYELLLQVEGIVPRVLEKSGVNVKAFTEDLKSKIDKMPKVSGSSAKTYAGPRLQKVFETSERETL